MAYGETKAHPCDVSLCAPGVIICFFQPPCGEAGIRAGRRGDLLPDSVAVAGDSGDRLCGVEKTWPLHSPNVEKIEVVRKGKVRRAKLNYLRDRVGKKAKVKELVK